MPDLQMLVHSTWPVLLLLSLPFLSSAFAGVLLLFVQRRLVDQGPIGGPTGSWLAHRLRSLPVEVHVSPELVGAVDGFWPRAGIIGLSPRTWTDRTRAGRTIAAHEFGHARLWHTTPRLARRLALARLLHPAALALTASGLLAGGLLHHLPTLLCGLVGLVLSVLAGLGILVDEALASRTGAQWLDSLGLRTRWTDAAMGLSFATYALPVLIRGGFLLAAVPLSRALLVPTPLRDANPSLALWAVLILSPVLLLRAAQVSSEVHTAVTEDDFRLRRSLFEEHTWAWHSGSIVLLWILLGHDSPLLQGLGPLLGLALLPAVPVLGGWGRTLLVLPFFLVGSLAGLDRPARTRSPRHPPPLDARRILPLASPAQRVLSLHRIAWLPLVPVLLARAISGW